MEKKSVSKLGVVVFLIVVLLVPTHTESCSPSKQEPFPIKTASGRKLMSKYKTNDIGAGGSTSEQTGGWNNP
ncbi:unnamed protein product [Cochlearia groenlandica]